MSAIIAALIIAAASFFVWLGSERETTKAVKKLEENARLSKTVREQAEEIGALKVKNLSLEKQLSAYKKQRSRSDMARGER